MLRRLVPPLALVAAALIPPAAAAGDQGQSTAVISTAMDGRPANGDSVAPAISGDRRWARYIAFESDATNLVPGDTNGQRDVFVVTRGGLLRNDGSPWSLGGITLISRAAGGGPADGPSGGAALDGSFSGTRGGQELFQPSCVAFVSSASNLVPDDTNGVADAFVSRGPGGALERVSAANGGVTQVAVSGDCSRIAFVEGGRVRVRVGGRIVDLGPGQDPSFAVGQTKDLVFGAPTGVKLARGAVHRAKTVVPGGANPAYNDVKRRIVAYEKGGQVAFRRLGRTRDCRCGEKERVVSRRRALGNARSHDPVIGSAGAYVTFTSDASNLSLDALGHRGDRNAKPDVYLYTDRRKLTLVQSVADQAVPAGGEHGTMSYYANYVLFDAAWPLGDSSASGRRQVFLRYLDGV
jgi:hypothetical protein